MQSNSSTARKFFAAIITLGLTCGAASADEYKVKLTRPEKVGDEYQISITATEKQVIKATVNGQMMPAKTEKFTAELVGKMKIEAVTEKFGQPTKLTVTVDKLTKDGDELLPANTVITVTKQGKEKSFVVDGEKVEPDKAKVLSSLLGVSDDKKEFCDDDTMGTDKPQAVGGTWDVNADNVVKDAAGDKVTVSADKVKGHSTLVEVKDVDSAKVMSVKTELNLEDVKMDLPGGPTVDDCTMAVVETAVLPVDESLPVISNEQKIKMTMSVTLANNGGTVDIRSEENRKATFKKAE